MCLDLFLTRKKKRKKKKKSLETSTLPKVQSTFLHTAQLGNTRTTSIISCHLSDLLQNLLETWLSGGVGWRGCVCMFLELFCIFKKIKKIYLLDCWDGTASCGDPSVRAEYNWSVMARWVNVFFWPAGGGVCCCEAGDIKLTKPRSVQCWSSITGKQGNVKLMKPHFTAVLKFNNWKTRRCKANEATFQCSVEGFVW